MKNRTPISHGGPDRRTGNFRFGRAWMVLMVAALLFGGCTPSGSEAENRAGKASTASAQIFPSWYENKAGYDRAMAEAKSTGKPMLVYIYATWCPHCKAFSGNILSSGKVRQMLIRYPHVRIAPEHGPSEKRIQEEFAVQGYPSFYVVRNQEEPVSISTYTTDRPKTPEEFVQSVLQAAEKR